MATPSSSTTRQQRGHARSASVPRTAFGAATAALALMVLAGCGSSSTGAPSNPATGAATSSTASTTPADTSSSTSATSTSATSATSPGSSSAPQATVTIHISAYQYTFPASVAPGATVSVMNMDDVNHTVTADTGAAFDLKATGGMTTTFVAPTTPGSYPFHCTYHANMHGVLVVK